jgi:GT2 family glycosyltransferase
LNNRFGLTLSIIIVNYNVKYFLEQCLYSVRKAAGNLAIEVIVVDNHSQDDSLSYLGERFPEVRFIANTGNTGFAKACNQGLGIASGQYILFLNPDTIVAEDSFTRCIAFFESHPDCGALGVKMIDGSGKFLRESKRSFPAPLTSLFKLFGFSALFPKSRVFSRYHLGHLDKEKNHEVDVLAGAYMMVRRDVLERTGGFDETFFMYGEDIDLSYRIQKSGYKNYYVADTTIIHFKGESTKKGSLNYVKMFYNAMSVFARKHYGGTRAGIFHASIQFAIWIRAGISALAKFIRWVGLPIIDAALILLSFWLVKEFWTAYIRPDIIYQDPLLIVSFPSFTLVYLLAAYYAGLYDRYYKTTNLVRSTVVATVVLLAMYALLPEKYRFSRGIVVFGALSAFILIYFLRVLLIKAQLQRRPVEQISRPHILVAASRDEFRQVQSFLEGKGLEDRIIGRININGDDEGTIASWDTVEGKAQALEAQEIVFCAGRLTYGQIIRQIQQTSVPLKKRFHALGSGSIVGSDASDSSGETVSEENALRLALPASLRLKRLIDLMTCLFFLVTFPVHLLLVKRPGKFFANCFSVLLARKTWIGYAQENARLPRLRPSVLGPNGLPAKVQQTLPETSLRQLDYWYALEYEPLRDLRSVLRNYRELGA